jgi:hypothetical protein
MIFANPDQGICDITMWRDTKVFACGDTFKHPAGKIELGAMAWAKIPT